MVVKEREQMAVLDEISAPSKLECTKGICKISFAVPGYKRARGVMAAHVTTSLVTIYVEIRVRIPACPGGTFFSFSISILRWIDFSALHHTSTPLTTLHQHFYLHLWLSFSPSILVCLVQK